MAGLAYHLKDWADARGLNNWAVAWTMQNEKGLKPRLFFNSTIERLYPKLGERITNIIAEKLKFDGEQKNK